MILRIRRLLHSLALETSPSLSHRGDRDKRCSVEERKVKGMASDGIAETDSCRTGNGGTSGWRSSVGMKPFVGSTRSIRGGNKLFVLIISICVVSVLNLF